MSNKPNPNRPRARRLVIADWETSQRDESTVVLDLGDDGEIEIDPPYFWSQRLDGKDTSKMSTEDFIRCIVGEEQTDLWLSTGRTMAQLDKAFTEAQGLTSGESGASSKS